MTNDVASLTGTARTVKLGGDPFRVYPLTVEDLGGLQAWVDRQFPNPFDTVNEQIERGRFALGDDGKPTRVPYSVAQQQFMIKCAMEQSEKGRHLIGTPEADSKLHTMEGVKQVLLASIRKGDPTFSDEAADALYRRMSLADVQQLVAITHLGMVTSDPKDPTPSGTKTSRRRKRQSTGGN